LANELVICRHSWSAPYHREPPELREPLVQRLPLEELHHEERATAGLIAEVEDLHDPGSLIDVTARASLKDRLTMSGRRALRRLQHLARGPRPQPQGHGLGQKARQIA
jgi:hypothetical protein